MTDHWQSSFIQRTWKHIWIHGFVIGVGVVLISFVITGPPPSSTCHKDEKAPQVQTPQAQPPSAEVSPASPPAAPPAPVDSTAQLKSQLTQVLAGIKEANQEKDLPQFLRHYSANFPKLHQRAQHISKTWKIYDYPKMDFEITEVNPQAGQIAMARVTWDIEAHNLSPEKIRTFPRPTS
jgi:hypothetical protein